MALFSIVTPSYNQASFLEQTMRSVLDQDVPGLEYFVIDGASTDASPQIIQSYASRLAYWVSEKDRGQADAINKGLQRATGEFVAWLNSDDYYLPGTLARVQKAFQDNPQAGLVYGDVLSVDGAGKTFNLQSFAPYNLSDLMSFKIISQPGVFMRASIFKQAGLLDPSYHYLLDHHLWLRMARLAPAVYIPSPLAAARYHPAAKNVALAADFGREAFRLVEWMQSSAEFAGMFSSNRARILAGAERFDAFYLLEGGQQRQALAAYRRAWRHNPLIVMREMHRVVYAAASIYFPAPLSALRSGYARIRSFLRTSPPRKP